MEVVFNTPYGGNRNRVTLDFVDEDGNQSIGLTEQSHKDECDINNIIRKYDKTGLITHVNNATAEYGDYTEINEYQESLNMVIKAQNAFDELPADIRKKFGNDPGAFFEFATNPDNVDGMIELGLAEKIPVVEEAIQKVEVVNSETK
jgi:phage internal scaffolding protein